MKEKERQFSEDICKVLVHEDPEVVFGLLYMAGINADVDHDNVFGVIQQIRELRK